MGLFSRKPKKEDKKETKKKEDKKSKSLSKSSKSEKKSKKTAVLSLSEAEKSTLLLNPLQTEKSNDIMALNKYVFKVRKEATKKEIKKIIESLYEVTVRKVSIINLPAKKRKMGRKTGFKSGYKKAVVSLKEGDKIELFEGV